MGDIRSIHDAPTAGHLKAGALSLSDAIVIGLASSAPAQTMAVALPALVAAAIASMRTGRPGPAALECAIDAWGTRGPASAAMPPAAAPAAPLDEDAIRAAAKRLGGAARPLIVVGGGAREHALAAADLVDGKIPICKLLVACGLAKGTNDARRLIQGGGVNFGPDRERVTDPNLALSVVDGLVLRVGSRRAVKLRVK